MDIDSLYESIINDLHSKEKVHFLFSPQQCSELENRWQRALNHGDDKTVEKILCLACHCREPWDFFTPLFISSTREFKDLDKNSQIIIFALGASWKHVVDRSTKTGERISPEFIETIRNLLSHPDPEVLEWTLRTVDQMGQQAMALKGDIMKIKIGWKRLFHKNKRASFQIIEMLLKRWKR